MFDFYGGEYINGRTAYKEEMEYDDNGEDVEFRAYREGYLINKRVSEKRERGQTTESSSYDGDGNLTRKNKMEYDDRWYIAKYLAYNPEGELVFKIEYSYDDYGNKTEQNYYLGDRLETRWKMKYNENGHIIEEKKYYATGELSKETRWTYLNFDKENNWTRMKQLAGDHEYYYKREIKYYGQ